MIRAMCFVILSLVGSIPASAYTQIPFIEKSAPRLWESSPFVLDGTLYRAGFRRPAPSPAKTILIEQYDPEKDVFWKIAEIPWSLGLGSVLVDGDDLWVFGSTDWTVNGNSIKKQRVDTTTWQLTGPQTTVVTAPSNVRIYNSSVTKGPDKYIMVYETNEFTAFTGRFLQSTDLETWTAIGAPLRPDNYNACQSVKYVGDGWYMVTWLWKFTSGGKTYHITNVGRTQDFVTVQGWQGNAQYSAQMQFLYPEPREGTNTSDNDFVEWNGKVYGTYFTGDQATWGWNNDWWYDGTLSDLYHEFWP